MKNKKQEKKTWRTPQVIMLSNSKQVQSAGNFNNGVEGVAAVGQVNGTSQAVVKGATMVQVYTSMSVTKTYTGKACIDLTGNAFVILDSQCS